MDIHTREDGSLCVVELSGIFDARAALDVRATVVAEARNGWTHLVLDLSDVVRIDSSGLGALVTSLKGVHDAGSDLSLAGPSAAVRSVIELTRLHRVFPIFDDVESARRELVS